MASLPTTHSEKNVWTLFRARVASPRVRQILTVFICLQILDVLTTVVGLRLGAVEGSPFVAHLLRCGTVSGLVFAKVIACVLAASALLRNRERLLRIVNFWFVAIVGWNLIVIALLNVRS
jgi:hypothetical protein